MKEEQPSGVLASDDPRNSAMEQSNSDNGSKTLNQSDEEKSTVHVFNEQTNYVRPRTIITIFLACATVDLVALMDQTTLAASLNIIGNALNSSNQTAWIASGYFMKLKAVDFVGSGLALAGTSVLMLGLTWGGGEYSWNSAHVIATIVVGFVVCVAFVMWQGKGAKFPLVPLHIFKSKIVNGACITMAINGWNFVVQVYYIPAFYQLAYNYSATKAGAMLLPVTLTQTLFSTLSGLVVHKVGRYRECILLGWVMWAVGVGLMSTLDENSSVGKQVGYSLLIGAGVGNTLQPALIAIQAGVSRRDMAVVTSFRNFIRNLGSTIGLAISGTLINNILSASIAGLGLADDEARRLLANPQHVLSEMSQADADQARAVLLPGYRQAFRIIFLVMAGLASVAFFVAFFLMPQVELSRPDDKDLKDAARKTTEEKKTES
ncbi:hypothetical protein Brms1b_008880 [Colletotrichum noveboracense]|nr:hypothetical protein Brms1b_008880 [Colletotrichum noveboracense]